ncbi:MAG: HEAT repeat domain-containing protein [Marinicellaceae bacterium]
MKIEIDKFRLWASCYPEKSRSGEWECDYENWSSIYSAFLLFIENKVPTQLSGTEIADIIYVIARENEMEHLIEAVALKEELFQLLIEHVINSTENEAKWQFAVALGECSLDSALAEAALLKLVVDTNEYTSRRALQSLGEIDSNHTESYCIKAWETNHEYQRIMALWVLKKIDSKKLLTYLELAFIDGRVYLVQNANEIKK